MTSLSVWLFSPYCAILVGYWALFPLSNRPDRWDMGYQPRVGKRRGLGHADSKAEGQLILIRLGARKGHGGSVQDWGATSRGSIETGGRIQTGLDGTLITTEEEIELAPSYSRPWAPEVRLTGQGWSPVVKTGRVSAPTTRDLGLLGSSNVVLCPARASLEHPQPPSDKDLMSGGSCSREAEAGRSTAMAFLT